MFDRLLNTPLQRVGLYREGLYREGGPYHIETSPLTCSANKRTGFYMIVTSITEELSVGTSYSVLISIQQFFTKHYPP